MDLDKTQQYLYQVGSDNQYRIHWTGGQWHLEFLAGGVLFDDQKVTTLTELEEALSVHGITLNQFELDAHKTGELYSQDITRKIKKLTEAGIQPCPKHGLTAKNLDDTCEACTNTNYPDDFKGTEG